MAGQFQSLSDLAAFLQAQAKPGNQIHLDQSVIDQRVSAVLNGALGRGDLILDVPWQNIVVSQNQLQFDATTPASANDTFLSLVSTKVNIAFSLQGASNEVNFVLSIYPAEGWGFGESYPALSQDPNLSPESPTSLAFQNPSFQLNTAPGASPVFFYRGTLPLTGTNNPVGDVLSMFPSAPSTVSFSGEIKGTADSPLFDLQAPLMQSAPAPLGGVLKINPPFLGVRVMDVSTAGGSSSSANGQNTSSGTTYKLSRNYVGADFPFAGDTSPLEFVAGIYPSAGYTMLGILPTDPEGANLTQLASFAGQGAADGIVNLFSSNTYAQNFYNNYLSKIVFDYCYGQLTFNPPALQFVTVSVKSNGTWPIIPGAFDVGFQFIWTVTNPLQSPVQQTASLAVNFAFNTKYTFALTVTVPGFSVNGKYTGPPITWDTDQLSQELFQGSLTIPLDISVTFTGLSLSMSPPAGTYSLTVSAGGSVTLFNTRILAIEDATLTISRTYSQGGTVQNAFSFNGNIFIGQLGFAVSATLGNGDTVFTIHMVDQTVGSLLTYLVSLVDPYLNLQLSPPWDKLNTISLDSLVLTINTTKGSVSLDYPINLNLGFVTLNKIGLVYQKATTNGQGVAVPSSVNFELDCTFLGIEYGGGGNQPALGWNPVTDRGPNVPGNGSSLFELQYLGLGQHVTPNIGDLTSMQGIIQAMQKAMVPGDQGSQSPLQLPNITFDPTAGWLIGANFTVLGTVSIAAIFSDPNLAGIRISLAGAKADIFAGLAFEILYKRVTPTIGLYHIELQLPDAMRNLQFGEVSITLPIIDLDIYTNGNFRIDFGFPKGTDFSRSFSIQVFPFVGYGGFYFAWLTGATSQRVPKISNGQFNPVIEFGVALSIGVGKTIDEGIFSAGASITVIGILQGVVAWFEPSVQSVKSDRYYWVQGTIAIMGKVYGKVDFKVIQVDVQIVASASVTLTIEAYMPIYIALDARVSVQASVKILFIKIHFSFSLSLHLDFTIGSKSNPPWQVVSGTNNNAPRQLLAQSATPHPQFPVHARHRVSRMRSMNLMRAPGSRAPMLQWTPRSVSHLLLAAAPTVQAIDVTVVPSFTNVSNSAAAVMLLFVENSIDPNATASNIRANVAGAGDAAFNQLIARLFLWAVQSLDPQISTPADVITACDLQSILTALTDPSIDEGAFSYANLSAFLSQNFLLRLVARTPNSQNLLSGTVFPMPPNLTLTAGSYNVDFSTYTPVSPAYQEQIDTYLAQLLVNYENEVEQSAPAEDGCGAGEATSVSTLTASGDPSMATVIFQDYFVMLARAAVQAAITHLQNYSYVVSDPHSTSLNSIAATYPSAQGIYVVSAADTVESLQASFGVTAANATAGSRLTVEVAVTAESVAAANRSQGGILQPSFPLPITGVQLQVTTNDTFQTLATRLGQATTFAPALLAANLTDPILSTGFALTVDPATAAATYTVQTGDTIRFVAAFYTVRLVGNQGLNPLTGLQGLVSSLLQLNPSLATQYGASGTLPNGTAVTLPQGSRTAANNDTLTLIAAANLAAQSSSFDTGGLIQAITTQNFSSNPPGPDTPLTAGTVLTMPKLSYAVQAGDSLAAIAGRLGVTSSTAWGSTLLNLPGMLAVSAVVLVPAFQYSIGSSDTLGSIAAKFNLSFEAFASSIAGEQGIFAANANLTVPNVPAQYLGQLQQDMLASGDFNNVATMVSRFLLHGLQLPQAASIGALASLHPQALSTVQTSPLYALLGQQFPLPAQLPDVVLSNSQAAGYEFYMATYTTVAGDTQAGIVNRFAPASAAAFTAALQQLNPTVAWTNLPTGTVLQFPGAESYITLTGDTLQSLTTRFAVAANAAMFSSALVAANPGVNFSQLPAGTELQLPVITSYTVVQGDTLQSIAAQFVGTDQQTNYMAAIKTLNPNVDFGSLTPGVVLTLPALTLWLPVQQLELSFSSSEQQLIGQIATTPFNPQVQLCTRLPLYAEAPVQYSMQQMLHWQWAQPPANSVLANSGQSAGEPTIWPFPDTLQTLVQDQAAQEPYLQLILSTSEAPNQPATTAQAGCYQWGTTVDVTIRTVPGNTASGTLANQYLMTGADAEGQQTLQLLGDYLSTLSPKVTTSITILYAANPSSANPQGLLSDIVNPAATALIQSNLSTVTQNSSNLLLAMDADPAPPPPAHTATIAETANFVRLLWEGSVVGGAGYYLNYVKTDGTGLPDSLFTQGSEATLTLLILINEPFTPPAPPPIHAFHNCAVVATNIDASSTNVLVAPVIHVVTATDSFNSIVSEVQQSNGITTTPQALATANQDEAGLLAIGVSLSVSGGSYTVSYGDTLASIAKAHGTDPATIAANNAAAAIFQQGALMALNSGQLQQTAAVPPGNTGFQLTRPNADPPPSGQTPQQLVESLFQLLAYEIAANTNFSASPQGLPAGPLSNDDQASNGLQTRFVGDAANPMWFYKKALPVYPFALDALPAEPPQGTQFTLPSPWTNPYRGIATNSQVVLGLQFRDIYGNTAPSGSAISNLTIPVGYYDDLIAISNWPAVSGSYSVAAASGASTIGLNFTFDYTRFTAAPGLSVQAATQAAATQTARFQQIYYQLTQPDVSATLTSSLNQSGALQQPYPVAVLPLASFAGSAYAFLAAAQDVTQYVHLNLSTDTFGGVAAKYWVNVSDLAQANSSVDVSLIFSSPTIQIPQFYNFPFGGTLSQSGLTQSDLLQHSTTVALNAGTDLSLASQPRTYTLQNGDTLRAIAASMNAQPGAVAAANATAPLSAGITLASGGRQIATGSSDSLTTMVTNFAAQGVITTAEDLGAANQDTPNLFNLQAKPDLQITDYVVAANDTLASLPFNAATLLTDNWNTINIYPAGAALWSGNQPYTVQSGDTLAMIAAAHTVDLGALANQNATLALATGSGCQLLIPCQVTASTTQGMGYGFSASDTLAGVAAKFTGLDAAALVALNRFSPMLFSPGPWAVGGVTITVASTDTFDTLYTKAQQAGFSGQFSAFASAAAAAPNIVATSALLACPPATALPGDTLAAAATRFGIETVALVGANAAVRGLLATGTSIAYQGKTMPITADDTLLTIAARFTAAGVPVALSDIAAQPAFNAAHILTQSAVMLIPPPPASLPVAFTANPQNPDLIFPVTVSLTISRNSALVDPDFADVPSVSTATTQLSPQFQTTGSDSALSLAQFGAAFESAFKGLKAGVSKRSATGNQTETNQLWAVDFRSTGFQFQVVNQPSYFSLAPLSTELLSYSNIPIQPYVSGQPLQPAQPMSFQAVDLDGWAQQFFSAVDAFLSPASAAAAFTASRSSLESILGLKSQIASQVSNGIALVSGQGQGDASQAQQTLEQSLLSSLATAYQISTVVQLPVTVTSPYTDSTTAPRLVGNPVALGPAQTAANGQSPSFSFSTAKIPVSSQGGSGSELNFLLTVKTPELDRSLNVSLQFVITEMEFDISASGTIDGYQPSSWLSFLVPIDQNDPLLGKDVTIGALNIPVPLHAYPSPPSVVAQSGIAATQQSYNTLQQQIAQIQQWTYAFSFSHQSADQDTRNMVVTFNSGAVSSGVKAAQSVNLQALFTALAQFVTVYPALSSDLANLTTLPAGQTNPVATNAVSVMNTLIQGVFTAWSGSAALAAPSPAGISFDYAMNVVNASTMTLTLASSANGILFPVMSAITPNGTVPMPAIGSPSGNTQTYQYTASNEYQLSFPGLNLIQIQSGVGGVWVVRNQNIATQVNNAFVYETPVSEFSSVDVPLIVVDNLVLLNAPPATGDFPTQLANFFNLLLTAQTSSVINTPPAASFQVKVAVSYAYQPVVSQTVPVQIKLPVLIEPLFPLSTTNYNQVAQTLGAAVQGWINSHAPTPNNAAIFVELSMYLPSDTSGTTPILQFNNIQYWMQIPGR